MLSRYIAFKGFKRIPLTGDSYEIDLKGRIRHIYSGEFLDTEVNDRGEPIIVGGKSEWFHGVKLAVVMAVTFRNLACHPKLWTRFDVLYRNDDPSDFRVTNTVWASPKGAIGLDGMPGFCVIPGFSRYLINRDGDIWSAPAGKLISSYEGGNGYRMVGVQPDVGRRTIVGQHRLLCLAFKEYPATVNSLDVNHIDGDKSNNELGNLEWVSRTRNNIHAFEIGLRTESHGVDVRDVVTGDIRSYFSIEECGRQLGLDGETIRLRTKTRGSKVYPPGLQFKLTEDDAEWGDGSDIALPTTGRKVKITSVRSGATLTLDSVKKAAEFFDRSPASIVWHIKTHGLTKPYCGHFIEYA